MAGKKNKSVKIFPLITLLILCGFSAAAQVVNDNFENRIALRVGEERPSSTVDCTVQRQCVDESLTDKCIVYHNDQWFSFTPSAPGDYFVNIGAQRCRDTRGVQLVVLTGTPCQPATYAIYSCTSLGNQDDVFVRLPALRAGTPYYLNVDGYIQDFCSFTIGVDTVAQGLPAADGLWNEAAVPVSSNVVTLRWQLPDSLRGAACRVLRRSADEAKSTPLARVTSAANTFTMAGMERAGDDDYIFTDTLTAAGNYYYQVVTEPGATAAPVRLLSRYVAWQSGMGGPRGPVNLRVKLSDYRNGTQLSVLVFEARTRRLLNSSEVVVEKGNSRQGLIRTEPLRAAGVQEVLVQLRHRTRRGKWVTDEQRFVIE